MVPASVQAHIPNIPIDWILIGVFALVLVVVALRMGTRVPIALSLALPIVAFALAAIPQTVFVSSMLRPLSGSLFQILLSVAVFVVFFILIYRTLGGGFMRSALPLPALVSGVAATLIGVIFLNATLGQNDIWHFGTQVQSIFGPAYRLFWLIASYLALALI